MVPVAGSPRPGLRPPGDRARRAGPPRCGGAVRDTRRAISIHGDWVSRKVVRTSLYGLPMIDTSVFATSFLASAVEIIEMVITVVGVGVGVGVGAMRGWRSTLLGA